MNASLLGRRVGLILVFNHALRYVSAMNFGHRGTKQPMTNQFNRLVALALPGFPLLLAWRDALHDQYADAALRH